MGTEIADKVLRGEPYKDPREPREGGGQLLKVANREPPFDLWYACIDDADTRSLIAAIAGFGSYTTGMNPAKESLREAARSMVEQKLTDRMIEKMDRLEHASNRLAVVGIIVAVIIAGAELWVGR